MPLMRPKLIAIGSFAVIAVCIFLYWQHTVQADREQERQDAAQQQAQVRETEHNRQSVLALTKRYSADADWERGLKAPEQPANDSYTLEKSESLSTYTVQVQRALINEQGRPVTIIATVLDVLERGEKPYVILEDASRAEIRFELEITPEQASTFTKRPRIPSRLGQILRLHDGSEHEHYAVIANIFRVERRQANARNTLLHISGDVFIATGRCVDFEFVGDYQGS